MSHQHGLDAEAMSGAELDHRRRAHRLMLLILAPVWLLALVGGALSAHWGSVHTAVNQDVVGSAAGIEVLSGEVIASRLADSYAGDDQPSSPSLTGSSDPRPSGVIDVRLEDGRELELSLQPAIVEAGIEVGDRVLVDEYQLEDGSLAHSFAGFDHAALFLVLVAAFALALVVTTGGRGLRALGGLIVSAGVLWMYTLPALIAGSSALVVASVTAVVVLTVVLYATHGFSARTTTALLGTLAGAGLAAALGAAVLHWGNLTGVGSDDDLMLWAAAPQLSMSHLLLAVVVLTSIGVLNDVTITQASAVWELSRARASWSSLTASALRIGRDHIASSVYTLVFVSFGASLTTYLLQRTYRLDLAQTLSSQSFVAEIVTTLVGAIAVISAMPATTWLGAWVVRSSSSPAGSSDTSGISPATDHEPLGSDQGSSPERMS